MSVPLSGRTCQQNITGIRVAIVLYEVALLQCFEWERWMLIPARASSLLAIDNLPSLAFSGTELGPPKTPYGNPVFPRWLYDLLTNNTYIASTLIAETNVLGFAPPFL
jgi:hypothetical protein